MTAISVSYTAIPSSDYDPDSPVTTGLFTDIIDNITYVYEWLGASYTAGAEQDHNHDGVNSSLILPGSEAGDYLLIPETAADASTNSSTYTKVIEFVSARSGEFTFKFDLTSNAALSGDATAYARIYRNGAGVGTEHTVTATAGNVNSISIDEDVSGWAIGDNIQLYLKVVTSSGTATATASDFGIYGAIPIIFVQTV